MAVNVVVGCETRLPCWFSDGAASVTVTVRSKVGINERRKRHLYI
jgi:hypothetical protein